MGFWLFELTSSTNIDWSVTIYVFFIVTVARFENLLEFDFEEEGFIVYCICIRSILVWPGMKRCVLTRSLNLILFVILFVHSIRGWKSRIRFLSYMANKQDLSLFHNAPFHSNAGTSWFVEHNHLNALVLSSRLKEKKTQTFGFKYVDHNKVEMHHCGCYWHFNGLQGRAWWLLLYGC